MSALPDSIDLSELLGPSADPVAAGLTLRRLGGSSPEFGIDALEAIFEQRAALASSDPAILGGLLLGVHSLLLRNPPDVLRSIDPESIVHVDSELPPACPNRHLLIQLLMMLGSETSLRLAVQRLKENPPADWIAAAQVLSPLMQRTDWAIDAVFPELIDTLEHPALASAVLDVANHVYRSQRTDSHPAAARSAMLGSLLSAVVRQLERFESDPRSFGDDVPTVQRRLGEAVSLAVSLCDSLGLIGQDSSVPRLAEAAQLKHRRVQTEASGALARLGDEAGRQQLLMLAAEPSARLRVIAYAQELGIEDEVDPVFRTETAAAEAELAVWLSQPSQMGLPPTSIEAIDHRRQLWPGFSNPVDCHLVRFAYDMGTRFYSNVGIAGPIAFAMASNVADLPIDDIYAIYAGWHAEHDDIFAVAAAHMNDAQRRLVAPLEVHLNREGYESLELELIGFLLDEHAAVYSAQREGKPCRVITDGLETIPISIASRSRPLSPGDLWNLFKGRKMLRTFNP